MANAKRIYNLNFEVSNFEIPPTRDALVIGKQSQVGACGAVTCMNALSPDKYELVKVDNKHIEAVLVRKSVLKMIPGQKLIQAILDEVGEYMQSDSLLKIRLDITILSSKRISIEA